MIFLLKTVSFKCVKSFDSSRIYVRTSKFRSIPVCADFLKNYVREPPVLVLKQKTSSLYHRIPSESRCRHPGLISTIRLSKISGYHILISMSTFSILDLYVSRTFQYTIVLFYSQSITY